MEESGKINEYTCDEGHVTRTGNLDVGVTPFIIGCKHIGGCDKMAQSCFYRCDQSKRPDWVWYRPDEEQFNAEYQKACEKLKKMLPDDHGDYEQGLRADMWRHLANGGLSLRKCNGALDLEKLGPRFRTRHG
jgi:hypothetical protein